MALAAYTGPLARAKEVEILRTRGAVDSICEAAACIIILVAVGVELVVLKGGAVAETALGEARCVVSCA